MAPQRPGERQHGLRLAVGSGLRPDVWRSFQRRFGPVRIVETYGMSEGNVTLFNYTGTPGAVGRCSFIYKVWGAGEGGAAPRNLPSPSADPQPAPLPSSSRPSRSFVTTSRPELRNGTRPDAASAPGRVRSGRGAAPGGARGSPVTVPAAAGETGLLIAPVTRRTPFLGYAGSPELSEQKLLRGVFAEGDEFFNTGDLVEQDEEQFVRFRDRIGDTFRCPTHPQSGARGAEPRGTFWGGLTLPIPLSPSPARWKGENVATTEVAEALLAHESLQEATVYGVTVPGTAGPGAASRPPAGPAVSPSVPSPAGHEGRAGMAALVLRPGRALDGPGLYRHLEQRLPPYARPRFLRLQVTG